MTTGEIISLILVLGFFWGLYLGWSGRETLRRATDVALWVLIVGGHCHVIILASVGALSIEQLCWITFGGVVACLLIWIGTLAEGERR